MASTVGCRTYAAVAAGSSWRAGAGAAAGRQQHVQWCFFTAVSWFGGVSGGSSNSIGWISSSPLGQQASAGMQQQRQQNTGKGRAVALGLVLGGSVADWERCRCLGALARGSPVYPRCRSGTPGTCLGGVYRSTAGASLPHCVQKWSSRGHGCVCLAWYRWKPSCLCGWFFGVGALPVVPSFQTVPFVDSCGVGYYPSRAVCSRPFRPYKGFLCSLFLLGSVATYVACTTRVTPLLLQMRFITRAIAYLFPFLSAFAGSLLSRVGLRWRTSYNGGVIGFWHSRSPTGD